MRLNEKLIKISFHRKMIIIIILIVSAGMNFAARRLDARSDLFGIPPTHLTGKRRACGHTASGHDGGSVDEDLQTCEGVDAIELLRAVLLRFDDDHAVLRNTTVQSGKQSSFDFVG